ncbi:hypothetical protein A7975_03265 [Bacillus sp. FJAT-26390]|nr:hypothetical protein A7975_03265 [Bacillus sp. FJAT-26390]
MGLYEAILLFHIQTILTKPIRFATIKYYEAFLLRKISQTCSRSLCASQKFKKMITKQKLLRKILRRKDTLV